MRKILYNKRLNCPDCKKQMRILRSRKLRCGIWSATHGCQPCRSRWLSHNDVLIHRSDKSLSGLHVLGNVFQCTKCDKRLYSARTRVANGVKIQYLICNGCEAHFRYDDGKFTYEIEKRRRKKKEVLPGARFVAGRYQSGSAE